MSGGDGRRPSRRAPSNRSSLRRQVATAVAKAVERSPALARSQKKPKSKPKSETNGPDLGSRGCRVEGCPKYNQGVRRDFMCLAHFKERGVEKKQKMEKEVGGATTTPPEGGAEMKKKEKKAVSNPPPMPPVKVAGKSAERAIVSPPPTSPDKLAGKSEKQAATTSNKTPTKSPPRVSSEERKGESPQPVIPSYEVDLNKDKWVCQILGCHKYIQAPKERGMCRMHYKCIFLQNASSLKHNEGEHFRKSPEPKAHRVSSSKAKKPSPDVARPVIVEPRKGEKKKRRGGQQLYLNIPEIPYVMPKTKDDRKVPSVTADMIAPFSKDTFKIWKALPAKVDLGAAPPLPDLIQKKGAVEEGGGNITSPTDPLYLNPKLNYNVILLSLKARMSANNYESALSLCHLALKEWYDHANECLRFRSNWGGSDIEIPQGVSTESQICDGLSGLWCVYVWMLQELINRNQSVVEQREQKHAREWKQKYVIEQLRWAENSCSAADDMSYGLPRAFVSLRYDGIGNNDIRFALDAATKCPFASRRSWPWIALARVVVLGYTQSIDGEDEHNADKDQATSTISAIYDKAIAICRRGIDSVSLKQRGTGFDPKSVAVLCKEINTLCDMKRRVQTDTKALEEGVDEVESTYTNAEQREWSRVPAYEPLGTEESSAVNDSPINASQDPLPAAMFGRNEAGDVLDYLVEFYSASEVKSDQDLVAKALFPFHLRTMSKAVFTGQIGIRCIHCRDVDPSLQNPVSVLYPRSIKVLPLLMVRMCVSHFDHCRHISEPAWARYLVLRNGVAPGGIDDSFRSYWEQACAGLGIGDSHLGGMYLLDNNIRSDLKLKKRSDALISGGIRQRQQQRKDGANGRSASAPTQVTNSRRNSPLKRKQGLNSPDEDHSNPNRKLEKIARKVEVLDPATMAIEETFGSFSETARLTPFTRNAITKACQSGGGVVRTKNGNHKAKFIRFQGS